MGAPTAVTIYVQTQSLPKNGSHQKWLHEALTLTMASVPRGGKLEMFITTNT